MRAGLMAMGMFNVASRCGLSSELLKLKEGVGGAVSGVHRLDCLWLHRRFLQGVFLDPHSLGFSEDVLDMSVLLFFFLQIDFGEKN